MFSSYILYFILIPALLPVALILFYVYSKDKKEREPIPLLAKTFVFGAIFALPCIPVESILGRIISSTGDIETLSTAFIQNTVGVALVEEFSKLAVILLYIWKNHHFNYRYDGIVYAVTASLGFAALENIIYVISYGTLVSIPRAIFAIPGHATFGVLMGFFLSRAKDRKLRGHKFSAKISFFLSLLVPMVVHGIYDFLLSAPVAEAGLQFIFYIFVIILDVIAFFTIRHDFKTDRPLGVDYTIIE